MNVVFDMDDAFMRSNRNGNSEHIFEMKGDGLGTAGQYDVRIPYRPMGSPKLKFLGTRT